MTPVPSLAILNYQPPADRGGDRKVGEALVTHPLINAVGFTGSLGGGRALFNLCAQRPEPIPFFGELGSVNPMFLLPEAMKTRATSLGESWARSLIKGAGQFCTNPGIAVVIDGSDADSFVQPTRSALEKVAPQVMLTDGIAKAYQDGKAHFDNRAPGLMRHGQKAFARVARKTSMTTKSDAALPPAPARPASPAS